MSQIFYQLYQPCGIFNQITSLELAIGLSNRYSKKLIIHNISNPPNSDYENARVPIYSANYKFSNRDNRVDKNIFPNIANLVDWENKENTVLINDIVDSFTEENLRILNLMEYYSSDLDKDQDGENDFSDGRKRLFIAENQNVYLKNTLGYYSRFFFNRNTELDKSLSSVKFKKEYYELAKNIADSIGNFSGIHFRLADHKGFFNANTDILDSGVDKLRKDLIFVMCTDEPDSEIIKNSSNAYLFLDNFILDNFYKEFRSLEFKEEVSFGILNNLVMHYSKDFIGSPGSTYTGYIQRSLNQKKDISWKIFGEKDYETTGKYSWNGYNKDTITKQWWREWKESRLSL